VIFPVSVKPGDPGVESNPAAGDESLIG